MQPPCVRLLIVMGLCVAIPVDLRAQFGEQHMITYHNSYSLERISPVDHDGDGDVDMIGFWGAIVYCENNGLGTFNRFDRLSRDRHFTSGVVFDQDGDGDPDIL